MHKVRNPYSLRPNQASALDVVKNQKRLANKRVDYPYEELPKSLVLPQQYSEGARKAVYSRPLATISLTGYSAPPTSAMGKTLQNTCLFSK